MGKQDYEEKKQARIDRYNYRAEKAATESNNSSRRAVDMMKVIPMGQPILIGHHSEKGHRALLKRSDDAMRKACNERDKSEHYERKAAAAEGNTAISSDDPEALIKLREKLGTLEDKRESMKSENKIARKNGTLHPYQPYQLNNLGANIRTVKKRITRLEYEADREQIKTVYGDGYRIEGHHEDNRIRIFHDEKPSRDTCKKLRSLGFRFSPSAGNAWQRQISNAGIYAARAYIEYTKL